MKSLTLQILAISFGLILSVAVVANLFTIARALQALVLSQRHQLNRSVAKLGSLKGEGFMHQMKAEVNLMTSMV
jgi:ankyrin repeat-rich membrane spanning protein